MSDEYKNSELWMRSLGSEEAQYKDSIELLRSAYLQMRDQVAPLTSHIAASAPKLTIHDVTHLDALWGISDLLAGNSFKLNPLEGFIFGAAVLLHDAGLCFEAYEGGKDGLRDTTLWKDWESHEAQRDPTLTPEEINDNADFLTLRYRHAEQAKELAAKEWPSGIFFIENSKLRNSYAELIGSIASSHHWDIEKIEYKFSGQKNPLPTFPGDWVVDPLKIACLLRCADAAHIDSLRAPAFLYGLLRRHGKSGAHWKAQSLLGKVCPDRDEKSLVVYTSTRSFTKDEVAAWWVVHDLITLIDKEIKSCNDLLKRSNREEMRVKAVKGANDPKQLSKYVEADGWTPSPVSLHVSNLESLIKKFGGEQLYGGGNKLEVVLRELIQNARDAVTARRELDDGYSGRIGIEIEKDVDGNAWVSVSDDGIGMSERVLTQVLLDFGTSFWISDLVCEEHPGLRSSSFDPVGQFGIGFYSIFMAADEVAIYTKKYKEGLEETRHLYFPQGLSLRPVFSTGQVNELPMLKSTKVKFKLKSELVNDFKIKFDPHVMGAPSFDIPIGDYIKRLVAGLDVKVYFKGIGDSGEQRVHDTIENICADSGKIKEWLQDISLSKYAPNGYQINSVIDASLTRMRPLFGDNGVRYGFAALPSLGTDLMFLTHNTIGGLSNVSYSTGGHYIGYMEHTANTAKRDSGNCCLTHDHVDAWVKDQVAMLDGEIISHDNWFFIANHVYSAGSDPIDILRISLKHPDYQGGGVFIYTLPGLFELLKKEPIAVYLSTMCALTGYDTAEVWDRQVHDMFKTFWPISHGGGINFNIINGEPTDKKGLLGCLWRYADAREYEVILNKPENRNSGGGKGHILLISLKEK